MHSAVLAVFVASGSTGLFAFALAPWVQVAPLGGSWAVKTSKDGPRWPGGEQPFCSDIFVGRLGGCPTFLLHRVLQRAAKRIDHTAN